MMTDLERDQDECLKHFSESQLALLRGDRGTALYHAVKACLQISTYGAVQVALDAVEKERRRSLGIDKTLEWDADKDELEWGLKKQHLPALKFLAKVARVNQGATCNYMLGLLRSDLEHERTRIEEALEHLRLSHLKREQKRG